MNNVAVGGGGGGVGGVGVLGMADLNGSLDSSMLSVGNVDTTARLEARKSLNLNSSGVGRMSFIKSAPGTVKNTVLGIGRLSMASKENDRCVRGYVCC